MRSGRLISCAGRAACQRVALTALLFATGTCGLPAQSLPALEPPQAVATITDDRLDEISGLVASRRHPGLYYVHNDSGAGPYVYLIDRAGQTRLTLHLKGAQAADYEDIALAPGAEPGTFEVCVADIGDNDARRRHITIYRFPEPELLSAGDAALEVTPRAYRWHYPEGPVDAEAFLVHPRTGHGYIITKRTTGASMVYRLSAPWNEQREGELVRVGPLRIPPALVPLRVVTAADVSPDGRRVAVRCYADGWEWRLPADTADADFDRIFDTLPVRLSLAPERQGEALCYSMDGNALLTLSEGNRPTLYEMRLVTPAHQPAP
ncbi:MAG: hypothetical protein AB1601_08960 [Planctomycetota bacterium]